MGANLWLSIYVHDSVLIYKNSIYCTKVPAMFFKHDHKGNIASLYTMSDVDHKQVNL